MFKGVFTALVTPFNRSGEVDFERLKDLVNQQIEGGVNGIAPVGTTGESPTLNMKEHMKVVETAIAAADGRVKVIAGTGGNATEEAVELTRQAKKAGADGTLQVTPYYNKPNQEGLYRHFTAVADIGLPVVLYNIPGRTGREIAIDTVVRLAEHPDIVALKEAGGSVDRVSKLVQVCDLDILSGDDTLTFPMMAVGGSGVISVASNLMPAEVSAMVQAALEGDWPRAAELHRTYHALFDALLSLDTNPIPIKTAMAMAGQIEEVFRMPLCETSDAVRAQIGELLTQYGVL